MRLWGLAFATVTIAGTWTTHTAHATSIDASPPCGTSLVLPMTDPLPANAPGFVVFPDLRRDAWPDGGVAGTLALTARDPSNQPVELSVTTDGRVLVYRPTSSLSPGPYALTFDDACQGAPVMRQATVVVGPAAPLPAELGTLQDPRLATAGTPDNPLWLEVSWSVHPLLTPYRELLDVNVDLDGRPGIADGFPSYRTPGPTTLRFPVTCGPSGQIHAQVNVRAHIYGLSPESDPVDLSLPVALSCADALPPPPGTILDAGVNPAPDAGTADNGSSGCTVARGRSASAWPLWLVCVLAGVTIARRTAGVRGRAFSDNGADVPIGRASCRHTRPCLT